jgi:hypothetical protein
MLIFVRRHPNLTAFVFGLSCVFLMLTGLEILLRLRAMGHRPEGAGLHAVEHAAKFFEADPSLGRRPRPASSHRRKQKRADGTWHECLCTSDAFARRHTPVQDKGERDSFALFSGGSFTFGEYLNDNETIPYWFARKAPCYQPYNYAFSGYGPQHLLIHARRPELVREVKETKGIAVYIFIDDHVGRACGELQIIAKWGYYLPLFTFENGEWISQGSIEQRHPMQHAFFRLAENVHLWTWYLQHYGTRRGEAEYDFTAAMIKEAADTLVRRFNELTFYTVIYPGQDRAGKMRRCLEKRGITCPDFTDLFPDEDWEKYHFVDGHPAPELSPLFAERLAQAAGCSGNSGTHTEKRFGKE